MSLNEILLTSLPTVAIRLNPNPLVSPLEADALRMNVLHASRNLAPNRQPMSILKRAIRNRNVLARSIRPRRINLTALDRHIVIAHARKHMVNHNIARAERIDRIRIRRPRRQNPHIPETHIIRVVRHNLPEPRVLHRHTFHLDVLRVVEHHPHRPRMIVPQHTRILHPANILPPDCPFPSIVPSPLIVIFSAFIEPNNGITVGCRANVAFG